MSDEFPRKKYKVVYADPPWQYDNVRTGGSLKSGASQKYKTMPLESIKALPVRGISADDSILFLWSTVPFLPDALSVMEAWGFKYKTMLTWNKTGRLGLGFWLRGQTEQLLIGVRGKVKPFRSTQPNIVSLPVSDHSRKPLEFAKLIERLTTGMSPRVELFARRKADAEWDVWGNQAL